MPRVLAREGPDAETVHPDTGSPGVLPGTDRVRRRAAGRRRRGENGPAMGGRSDGRWPERSDLHQRRNLRPGFYERRTPPVPPAFGGLFRASHKPASAVAAGPVLAANRPRRAPVPVLAERRAG